MPVVEYPHGSRFPGRIGLTTADSSPAWPQPIRATEGAPNVLFFVLDDVGYGQLSTFGGLVETPNIDRVAEMGLRFANMHTTALCSPTRSCILTGRNHHSNGVASIMETATGYPGYDARMPFENGMLSEILRAEGYNTFCVGKWHLSPAEDNTPAGPFHRWPVGRGFERFYGFLGGETNQWYPDLTEDNRAVEPPRTPEEGYHLSEDLADQAIRMILDAHVNAPEKPFFMYYATGCGHAPHHVAKEWADKYAGRFDDGWDAYREKVFARQQELGIVPAARRAAVTRPGRPRVGIALARRAAAVCPLHGGLRRLRQLHRPPFRTHPRHARADRRARQHHRHGHQRQRCLCRGRSAGLDQRDALLQQRARVAGGQPRQDRHARGYSLLQPLPVGLGLGRRHALPTLEARNLSGWLDGPVRHLLAGRHQGTRRGARAVRTRHRHGADGPRGPGHRGAIRHPRRSPVADRRRLLRRRLRRRVCALGAHHAVLRDVRPPRHRSRRLAGGLPLAGCRLHERGGQGPRVRLAHRPWRARRARDRGLGALPHHR